MKASTARAGAGGRRLRRERVIFRVAAFALGALQAWAARRSINPDGISYLDLGDAWLRRDWPAAFNGLWSPLYSWLVSLVLHVVRPSPRQETTVVHLCNFLIYLWALWCFERLLRELEKRAEARYYASDARASSGDAPPTASGALVADVDAHAQARDEVSRASPPERVALPAWAVAALGYTIFLWASLRLIGLSLVTPDMLAASFVYLACAATLRVARGDARRRTLALVGASLGAGYLAKAAMLPFALMILACVALLSSGPRISYSSGARRGASLYERASVAARRAGVAASAFLVVASVYFVPLSLVKGRPTFGDSAKLNYAWYVNGTTRHIHWRGEPPGSGVPVHPTRKIWDDPPAYEFGTPFKVTYPPWYDPSYWYEGARTRFDAAAQLSTLRFNARTLFDLVGTRAQALWAATFIALCVWGRLRGARREGARQDAARRDDERWDGARREGAGRDDASLSWPLLLPSLGMLFLLALVKIEDRYVGAFVVLAWLAVVAAARVPRRVMARRVAPLAVALLCGCMVGELAPGARNSARAARRDLRGGPDGAAAAQPEVVDALREAGVREGDGVASVGYAFGALWARLARVRVVAEVTSGSLEAPTGDVERFWRVDPGVRAKICELFAASGAKVVVADRAPDGAAQAEGWRRIGETNYYLRALP